MSRRLQLLTADELMELSEDDWTYELAEGRLIRMSKPGMVHGLVGTRLYLPLASFVEHHRLGVVFPQDTGFLLARDPDTVRGPDLSFVTRARVRSMGFASGFLPGAPDLAVEVRSPGNRLSALTNKALEYLQHGSRLVWVIDPKQSVVLEFRPGFEQRGLNSMDWLEGGDVVPGFRMAVSRLFEDI